MLSQSLCACPAQHIVRSVGWASCGHAEPLRRIIIDLLQCTAVLGCMSGRVQCAVPRVCPVLREVLLQESGVPVDVHVGHRKVREVAQRVYKNTWAVWEACLASRLPAGLLRGAVAKSLHGNEIRLHDIPG